MSATFAALGEFGDAISFIFTERENQRGSPVGGAENLPLLWEHLKLTAAAMALALVIALPLGLVLGHTGRFSFLAISTSNVGRAVPSVALIALFIAFFPRSPEFLNVTLALALLAIPPILTNAYVGVRQTDRDAVDAARGMGLSGAQIIRQIELPLALPLIFGGIKTSTVNVIATATIAPLVGVVTLGDPLVAASVYGREGQIGASIIVAVLAILAEVGLSAVQRAVTPDGIKLARGPEDRARTRFGLSKRRIQTAP
ncbi:ABC transporter permease [Solirubrobacter phytolaccae]|uniref:ABC transporter permease n=1 Tax=Solirubrobacter phytolaccae TaxID=1404360 RepID=A0A9X3NBP5_9ACTN|nr:ABC transporter permease [Solirubrobacter phytolaccae]MDA0182139.1 ABC transporter permease [Solirubrobacter phytolaccae]